MRAIPLVLVHVVLCAALGCFESAEAQYIYLDSDGDGLSTANDSLRVPGTTKVDIWLSTNQNRDGSAANCPSGEALTLTSYEVLLRAVDGTVAWGPYTNSQPVFGVSLGLTTTPTLHRAGYLGGAVLSAGTYMLGSVNVFVTSGRPRLEIAAQDSAGAFATVFGSYCAGTDEDNTLKLGQDWADVSGLSAAAPTVITVETFDVPNSPRWTTSGSPVQWAISNCGHYLGTSSATAMGPSNCCTYPANVSNSLTTTDPLFISSFQKYQMSFLEQHRLNMFPEADKFYYAYRTGASAGSLPNLYSNEIFGENFTWERVTPPEVDNTWQDNNYLKPVFGAFTYASSQGSCYGIWVDSLQIYGTRRPDLVITRATIIPATPVAGQPCSLQYTVKNVGDLPTGSSFSVRSWLHRTGVDVPIDAFSEGPLAARDSITKTYGNVVVSTAATYQLHLNVDDLGAIVESHSSAIPETNNHYLAPNTYVWSAPVYPDLFVELLSVSNATPSLGDTVVATAIVRNNGPGTAAASVLGFYKNPVGLLGPSTPTTQTAPVPLLPPGATATVPFKTVSTSVETCSLYVLADQGATVAEANVLGTGEQNNVGGPVYAHWASGVFTVRGHFVYDDSTNSNEPTAIKCSRVEVWHDDAVGPDSLLATGAVINLNGEYQVGPITNLDATPLPGGDAILDVYVRWVFQSNESCWDSTYADQPIATVMVGDQDSVWHFDTHTVPNIPNTLYDFDWRKPAGYLERSAVHILDRVQRAWEGFGHAYRALYGTPGPIIVRWDLGYEAPTGYDPDTHEMFINGQYDKSQYHPDEWNNWSIAHEYGHHLLETIGALPEIPDDSLSADEHFFGAPASTLARAWEEGFADFAGHALGGYSPPSRTAVIYGMDPNGTTEHLNMDIENGVVQEFVGPAADTLYNDNEAGPLYEFAIASLLWDIQDSVDDNPNADHYGDIYSSGWGAIWQVVLQYSPGQIVDVCDYKSALLSLWCCDATARHQQHAVFGEHGIVCDALGMPTAVQEAAATRGLRLYPSTPNPFNPMTQLRFDLPAGPEGQVTLAVFDVNGRRVKTLCDRNEGGGAFEVVWDGTSDHGKLVGSGVYFCQLQYRGQRRTQRVTLLK